MKNFKLILILLLGVSISCNSVNSSGEYSYTKWKVGSQGNKIRKSEFKSFDNQGNLTKWIQYLDDGKSLTDSFSYEFKGSLKTIEYRYSNGKLWTKTIFIYGKGNKITETKCFDRDNKTEDATKHKFLDKSEIIENYSSDGTLYSIDSLIYNKNKKISEIQYLSDGTWFQKHKYKYDSKGNLVIEQSEANFEFDGIGLVESTYIYNSNNRPIKEIVLFPDKSKEYYIYEYTDKLKTVTNSRP